jgi:hypothetical protein
MRRVLAVLAASAALVVPAAAPARTLSERPVSAVIAKSCSAGYRHAVIGGQEKCLRRGQYCASRYRKQYPRYGFKCVPTSTGWRLK